MSGTALQSQGDRLDRVLALRHNPSEVDAHCRSIYLQVLGGSDAIETGNFQAVSISDLKSLFTLYDRLFFGNLLADSIQQDGASLTFRLSPRMTSAGGTTERLRPRSGSVRRDSYTITVSTVLLFQSFRESGRRICVGGLECKDRLEALQRVFEHELLHLTEFLVWDSSSCSRANFHHLSQRIFGHAGVKHELVTPREVAATQFGIRTGDRVTFVFEGVQRTGIVNRITKRATVLVEDQNGRLFSNGTKYATFYVPISLLQKERGPDQGSA